MEAVAANRKIYIYFNLPLYLLVRHLWCSAKSLWAGAVAAWQPGTFLGGGVMGELASTCVSKRLTYHNLLGSQA